MTTPDVAWLPLLPFLLVTGTAVVVLVADLVSATADHEGLGWLGVAGLIVTAVVSALLWNTEGTAFGGTLVLDRYAAFLDVVFCLAGIITLLVSMDYLPTGTDVRSGEYYPLVLFALAGMFLMVAAADLVLIFLGLEVMSVGAYVLTGIWRRNLRANEAGLKYFLIGAFATGFLLFGMAFFYGAFGTTALAEIGQRMAHAEMPEHALALAGAALLIVGFAFKMAAVPFHQWTPDVYEGAPTSVTAYMAVGVKAAAVAAFARVFLHYLAPAAPDWNVLLWGLAVATMTVGNLLALAQTNIKRLLACSSIAHAGYLLVGVVAGGSAGGPAVLYYLLVYALMNFGAFGVAMAMGRYGEPNEDISEWAGVGFRHPFLGLCMTVFMLSLAGFPALAGFTGKFYLFAAAVREGYVWLAVIAVLNSVVSVYYYAGVLVRMFMNEGDQPVAGLAGRPYLTAALALTAAGTVWLGVLPGWAFDLAERAFASLG